MSQIEYLIQSYNFFAPFVLEIDDKSSLADGCNAT